MAYRKSKRGLTLVGKDGRITTNSKKNVEKFKEAIMQTPGYTAAEKETLINDLDARIYNAHKNKRKLTTTGFMGAQESDKIERLLTNAGYTADELAKEIGVSEEDILNSSNWEDGVFMGTWELSFNYTSSILVKRGA